MDKTVVTFAAAAVMGWAALSPSAAMSQAAWDMPTEQSQTSLTGIADLAFSDAVRKKTKDGIKITAHFGGSLGFKTADQYEAVSTGAVVLADSYTGPLVGFDPIWQVSALPFLTADTEEAWKLYQASKSEYEQTLAADNMVLLYTIPWTPSGIWSRSPIKEMADIEGLKIRVFDPAGENTFKTAGAEPVIMPFTDVIPQLTTGGIDAVLTSAEGGYQNKFPDLLKNFTVINYASPLSIVHINADVWSSLPEAQKSAIQEAAQETEKMIWDLATQRESDVFAKMRAEGVTIIEKPSPELSSHLQSAASQSVEEWEAKAGERGAKILKAYR